MRPAGVRDSENWDRLEAPLVANLRWRFDGHGREPTLHRLRPWAPGRLQRTDRSRLRASIPSLLELQDGVAHGVRKAIAEKGRTAWRCSILNLVEGRPPAVAI